MQWTPPLLLLLLAVDAVQPLTCVNKFRYGSSVEDVKNATWSQEKKDTCNHGTTICARWLIKRDSHDPSQQERNWQDYYGGCYDNRTTRLEHWQTKLVRKYCADGHGPKCASTQYFWHQAEWGHRPAYLCCCHADMCNGSDIYAYAEQHGALSTHKPPSGPKQNYTCEASMRSATTLDGLLNATAVYNRNETCEAAWAPCVEFVYKNEDDGLWRRWRAGCSYKYGRVNYARIVEQFCTASGSCAKLDMVEPEGRARRDAYTFLDTYACCCNGSECEPPDAIDYYKRVALTTLPPSSNTTTTTTTTTASSTTTKQTTKQPTTTMTTSKAQPSTPQGSTTELSSAASAMSTSEQSSSAPERPSSTWTDDDDDYDDYDDTTESPGGGGFAVWLLVAIAAVVVVGAVVAAAVVVARRRTREIHDDGLLPASLFPKYPWQPNKPGGAPVSAQKGGAKSLLADTQMTTEAVTAAASSASPSQPDETQHAPTTEATTQQSLSAEATTQQQGDDSKARSPEGLSTK